MMMNAEYAIPAGGPIAVRSAACAAGRTEEVMASPRKLVIWGAGGHAKVVADIMSLRGEYVIAGFLDDVAPGSNPRKFLGAPLYHGLGDLDRFHGTDVRFLILALCDCCARLALSEITRARGWWFPTAVHPSAVIANSAAIGAGTVVAAGAVVNPEVRMGEHVIVNISASIDHECVIGDAAHIGPGAHLAGRVTVGRAAAIGIGASVLPGSHDRSRGRNRRRLARAARRPGRDGCFRQSCPGGATADAARRVEDVINGRSLTTTALRPRLRAADRRLHCG
jgi:sugar O-acyltransferase (sialic acid O-acetyltransferase NeuD family)